MEGRHRLKHPGERDPERLPPRRPPTSTHTWELGVPGATALLVACEAGVRDDDQVSTCCNVFWERACLEPAASLVDEGATQRRHFVVLASP